MKNFIWKFLDKNKYQNIKYKDKKKKKFRFLQIAHKREDH